MQTKSNISTNKTVGNKYKSNQANIYKQSSQRERFYINEEVHWKINDLTITL